ncbi:unnamed protein product, partial [Amoebophrya sp. A25]|eukprot:GSA25T00003403001.1
MRDHRPQNLKGVFERLYRDATERPERLSSLQEKWRDMFVKGISSFLQHAKRQNETAQQKTMSVKNMTLQSPRAVVRVFSPPKQLFKFILAPVDHVVEDQTENRTTGSPVGEAKKKLLFGDPNAAAASSGS